MERVIKNDSKLVKKGEMLKNKCQKKSYFASQVIKKHNKKLKNSEIIISDVDKSKIF